EPQSKMVYLALYRPGRRAAEQLAVVLWWKRMGIQRAYGAILLPCLPARTARPQLAQSRSRRRDAERFALLVGARRRRLSGGCTLAFNRRRSISRQSSQPELARG